MNPAASPTPAGTPVIEMQGADISASHEPETVVLSGVTWTIRAGEFWAVGGLPGCGKSDLLATAAGLQKPASGDCFLFGRATALLDEDETVEIRQKVGFVFSQEGRLFPHLTLAENVALPISYHHDWPMDKAMDRAEELIDAVELGQFASNTPATVGRHLRSRAALARALALDPELLILDDPLKGLDARQKRWWTDFLSGLVAGTGPAGKKGITIVAATDSFRPWVDHAKKFALLKDQCWLGLGGRDALQPADEPVLQELLA